MDKSQKKLERLKEILASYKKLLVCYSGGTDSTFLLAVAREVLAYDMAGLFFSSVLIAEHEKHDIHMLAQEMKTKLHVVENDIFDITEILSNPENRCAICKNAMMTKAIDTAAELGFEFIAEASTIQKDGSLRPEMTLLKEFDIKSPLIAVGFTRSEIFHLSHELGYARWIKPHYSCLLTRFPIGEEITPEKLKRVEIIEEFMWQLGFYSCRIESIGTSIRLLIDIQDAEPFLGEYRATVEKVMRQLGFSHAQIVVGDTANAVELY